MKRLVKKKLDKKKLLRTIIVVLIKTTIITSISIGLAYAFSLLSETAPFSFKNIVIMVALTITAVSMMASNGSTSSIISSASSSQFGGSYKIKSGSIYTDHFPVSVVGVLSSTLLFVFAFVVL